MLILILTLTLTLTMIDGVMESVKNEAMKFKIAFDLLNGCIFEYPPTQPTL